MILSVISSFFANLQFTKCYVQVQAIVLINWYICLNSNIQFSKWNWNKDVELGFLNTNSPQQNNFGRNNAIEKRTLIHANQKRLIPGEILQVMVLENWNWMNTYDCELKFNINNFDKNSLNCWLLFHKKTSKDNTSCYWHRSFHNGSNFLHMASVLSSIFSNKYHFLGIVADFIVIFVLIDNKIHLCVFIERFCSQKCRSFQIQWSK